MQLNEAQCGYEEVGMLLCVEESGLALRLNLQLLRHCSSQVLSSHLKNNYFSLASLQALEYPDKLGICSQGGTTN